MVLSTNLEEVKHVKKKEVAGWILSNMPPNLYRTMLTKIKGIPVPYNFKNSDMIRATNAQLAAPQHRKDIDTYLHSISKKNDMTKLNLKQQNWVKILSDYQLGDYDGATLKIEQFSNNLKKKNVNESNIISEDRGLSESKQVDNSNEIVIKKLQKEIDRLQKLLDKQKKQNFEKLECQQHQFDKLQSNMTNQSAENKVLRKENRDLSAKNKLLNELQSGFQQEIAILKQKNESGITYTQKIKKDLQVQQEIVVTQKQQIEDQVVIINELERSKIAITDPKQTEENKNGMKNSENKINSNLRSDSINQNNQQSDEVGNIVIQIGLPMDARDDEKFSSLNDACIWVSDDDENDSFLEKFKHIQVINDFSNLQNCFQQYKDKNCKIYLYKEAFNSSQKYRIGKFFKSISIGLVEQNTSKEFNDKWLTQEI